MADSTEAEASAPAPSGGSGNLVPLIVSLLNTLAFLGVAGFFYYTKFVFKRPAITESLERAKLEANPKPRLKNNPGVVPFDPITINILEKNSSASLKEGRELSSESELHESFHYITLAYELQIQDIGKQDHLLGYKTQIADKTLQLVGKRSFDDLNSVNGRFVLKNEIIDYINEFLRTQQGVSDLVTDLYFTQFTLQ